jgi:hypothetical protein
MFDLRFEIALLRHLPAIITVPIPNGKYMATWIATCVAIVCGNRDSAHRSARFIRAIRAHPWLNSHSRTTQRTHQPFRVKAGRKQDFEPRMGTYRKQ